MPTTKHGPWLHRTAFAQSFDMSLVRRIERESVKRRLMAAIVSPCQDLGTLVVAEGIECEP